MSRFEKSGSTVYYDAVLHNPTSTNAILQAQYSENKNQIILKKQNDYSLTVVRFQIPTSSIPLFDFLNNTYSVTVNNSQTFLIYVSSGNIGPQQVDQPVRSVQDFLDMINTALNTSYIAAGSPGAAGAPIMIFSPTTQLFTIVVPQAFVTAAGTLFFNDKLFQKFGSFQTTFNGFGTALGQDFEITVQNNFTGNLVTPYAPLGVNAFLMSQEVPLLSLLFDVQNIVITSNMEINEEVISSLESNGVASSLPILTDFAVSFQPSDLLQPLIYNANPYRLVDLISDQPLTRFEFRVFWEDKNRILHPLLLLPGDFLYIKLGFFRKSAHPW